MLMLSYTSQIICVPLHNGIKSNEEAGQESLTCDNLIMYPLYVLEIGRYSFFIIE